MMPDYARLARSVSLIYIAEQLATRRQWMMPDSAQATVAVINRSPNKLFLPKLIPNLLLILTSVSVSFLICCLIPSRQQMKKSEIIIGYGGSAHTQITEDLLILRIFPGI